MSLGAAIKIDLPFILLDLIKLLLYNTGEMVKLKKYYGRLIFCNKVTNSKSSIARAYEFSFEPSLGGGFKFDLKDKIFL